MAKIILKYDDRILGEIALGSYPTSIGRLPDNAVVIDNPAVSGHHARLVPEGEQHFLEDLHSTNGTFVNGQRITRQALADGDVVLVGKHKLVYEGTRQEERVSGHLQTPSQPVAQLQATIMLDTKAHRELLAKVQGAGEAAVSGPKPIIPGTKVGTLSVISGSTDKSEYALEAATSMVGKSKTAQIRLTGWFKPDVAAAITRNVSTYVISPLKGKTKLNDQLLVANQELKEGDVLQVSGVKFKFHLR
jgi:pSer/pThr/pTyr-binding forkhead associated (FHA) protein